MTKLQVLKFPAYYTQKNIDLINNKKPDIFIFDDNFCSSLDKIKLPNSIIYLDLGKNFN